jgi:hypothetical protein
MSDTSLTESFDELVDRVLAAHVVADGLPYPRAYTIAQRVFMAAVIDENNRVAMRHDIGCRSDDDLEQWDGIQATAKAMALLRERTWTVEIALYTLISCCFKRSRNGDFLDTDEIKTFAGSSYAAGVIARRQFPGLVKRWIETGH